MGSKIAFWGKRVTNCGPTKWPHNLLVPAPFSDWLPVSHVTDIHQRNTESAAIATTVNITYQLIIINQNIYLNHSND